MSIPFDYDDYELRVESPGGRIASALARYCEAAPWVEGTDGAQWRACSPTVEIVLWCDDTVFYRAQRPDGSCEIEIGPGEFARIDGEVDMDDVFAIVLAMNWIAIGFSDEDLSELEDPPAA